MFTTQLQEHQRQISSSASRPQERKMALRSGIEWADDAVSRLDDENAHSTSEFHRRKAAWKRDVAKDEKPREILEQTRLARTYRFSGWLAILIELIIATATLIPLLILGLSFAAALTLALVIAALITVAIAYALHGGITALVTRWGDPLVSYDRLKKYFVLPAFLLMVLSIIAYVAIQRLDAETLYYLQPVFSSSKFTAMLGFMVFGTALLVAADLLDWSLSRAAKYKALKDERQKIVSKRREWQEELEEAEKGERVYGKQQQIQAPITQETPPDQQATSSNGNYSDVSHGAVKVLPVLLILAVAFGFSACSAPPQVKMTLVQERMTYEIAIDASGPCDGRTIQQARQQALHQAGLNILKSLPKTVEQQRVNKLSVFWFGPNGWNAEPKLAVELPPPTRVEVVKRDAGELEKIRPEIRDVDKHRNEEALKEAEERVQAEYRKDIEKSLSPFKIDVLVPPSSVESRCSDLNGTLSRFTQHSSETSRKIVLIVSDGRQNCEGKNEIEKIAAGKNVAIVIVLVPGTESDGRKDFEARKASFTEACPQCLVVPYYRADLDQIITEAINKANEI